MAGRDTGVDADDVVRVLERAVPAPIRVERIEPLSGGASAVTCAVDLVDGAGQPHALILRRGAVSGSETFNTGVGKLEEARVQQAARKAGVPAVEVLAVFEGDAALGTGYLITDDYSVWVTRV